MHLLSTYQFVINTMKSTELEKIDFLQVNRRNLESIFTRNS